MLELLISAFVKGTAAATADQCFSFKVSFQDKMSLIEHIYYVATNINFWR